MKTLRVRRNNIRRIDVISRVDCDVVFVRLKAVLGRQPEDPRGSLRGLDPVGPLSACAMGKDSWSDWLGVSALGYSEITHPKVRSSVRDEPPHWPKSMAFTLRFVWRRNTGLVSLRIRQLDYLTGGWPLVIVA